MLLLKRKVKNCIIQQVCLVRSLFRVSLINLRLQDITVLSKNNYPLKQNVVFDYDLYLLFDKLIKKVKVMDICICKFTTFVESNTIP